MFSSDEENEEDSSTTFLPLPAAPADNTKFVSSLPRRSPRKKTFAQSTPNHQDNDTRKRKKTYFSTTVHSKLSQQSIPKSCTMQSDNTNDQALYEFNFANLVNSHNEDRGHASMDTSVDDCDLYTRSDNTKTDHANRSSQPAKENGKYSSSIKQLTHSPVPLYSADITHYYRMFCNCS